MKPLLSLLALCISLASFSQDPSKLITQGQELFDQGKYAEAKKKFAKVVKDYPSASGYLFLGLCQYNLEEYPDAVENFDQVLETHAVGNLRMYALRHKAYAYFQMDSLTQAQTAFKDYEFEFQLNSRDFYYLSFIHTRLNEPEASMGYIEQCQEKDPNSAWAALMMYHLFYENWEETLMVLDTMSALDPEFAMPMNNAYCHSMLGNYTKADSIFQEIKDMKDPQYMNNYGYNLYFLGQKEKGMELLQKALEKMPENSYILRNLAVIAHHENRSEEACDYLNQALALGYTTEYGLDVERWVKDWCK